MNFIDLSINSIDLSGLVIINCATKPGFSFGIFTDVYEDPERLPWLISGDPMAGGV